MIVKPQGGGKTYANTGTCANVASYLQHEDLDRMKDGKEPEPFFSLWNDRVSEILCYHCRTVPERT